MTTLRLQDLGRRDDWTGVHAVVAGLGVSGLAAARCLLLLGAQVTALDDSAAGDRTERAASLQAAGADVRVGPGSAAALPDPADVVVTSPGWAPSTPLLQQATRRGIPIWGEVELAWRLRDPRRPAPWLAVTGTNGKTTTVRMLEAILRAAGLRAVACGNVGLPIVEAVTDPTPYDVLSVELSSFQLHYTFSMAAESAAVLNVAQDHLDWHACMADYVADKRRVYQRVRRACVYNVGDPRTERLVAEAGVGPGARAVGFTVGTPLAGMVGVVDGELADRAFVADQEPATVALCPVADLASQAPHFVANALAAAALARSYGVPAAAVRTGLGSFRPDGHRIADVAVVHKVRYVDDSKATNPAAAQASLLAYSPVVWVAGGLAKGAAFDGLVTAVRDRLRAVVTLGRDRGVIADALARHAPEVHVIEVSGGDTCVMERAVAAAAAVAQPGDTVLLAPGCASMDMFENYKQRGDAFADAVRRLHRAGGDDGERQEGQR